MTPDEFYEENYEPLIDRPLLGKVAPLEQDDEPRRCRFCAEQTPDVTFKEEAHAVPEALGNRSLASPNECDNCNRKFGNSYEDHLGKAMLFERAATGIRGKNGSPTNKEANGLRIEWIEGKQAITITDPKLFEKVYGTDGQLNLPLTSEGLSQPFVPRYAAMALVKAACSLCPPMTVPKIQPTIDWLMGRAEASISPWPVLYTHVNGDNPYGNGRALLLRRTGTQPMPFLWCIIASGNHRLQFFVPFTTEDSHLAASGHASFKVVHYPVWIESNDIDYEYWDWSSDTKTTRSFHLAFDIQEATIKNPDGTE